MRGSKVKVALLGGLISATLLALPSNGLAQVSSMNSEIIDARVFNDVPGATGTYTNDYPTAITLAEANVSSATGFADRDVWYFSNNSGGSAYPFQDGGFFDSSFTVNLTGGTAGSDIEAGYLFSNPSGSFGGDLQMFVNGAGVVAQVGGPSYYPFSPAAGGFPGAGGSVANYTEGTPYTMGLNYVLDPGTGKPAFQYSVNGQFAASAPGDPYFDITGTLTGSQPSTLGGYFQIQTVAANPTNSGQAVFSNISITAVPEPASLALLGLSLPALLARRRKVGI